MKNKSIAVFLGILFLSGAAGFSRDELPDSAVGKLIRYAAAAANFGKAFPQEKVYLHLDNTSYYQGDRIWFQGYVVASGSNRPTDLSKTLYVELLNPGGEIIARRILPVRNGRCPGDFPLTRLPFYSGFYEIRAYTKYMLNFGEDAIFSRIIPVFDRPEKAGDFSRKEIRKQAVYKYPQKRKREKKAKEVNLKFFPEGGNLIEGVPSLVGFEATDAYGNPLAVSGAVLDREGQPSVSFSATHEGRGAFPYTPAGKAGRVRIDCNGKTYRFDLPEPLPRGFVLEVDNLSSADSLGVRVQKNSRTPAAVLGLAVVSGGKLSGCCVLNLETDDSVQFRLDKTGWLPGVSRIVLFDTTGRAVADRLIFVPGKNPLRIGLRKNETSYRPFDPIEMEFSVRDSSGRPVRAPLSVSVRDGAEEVVSRNSLLSDLLLMSEIKGYVRRPSYYFESDDDGRRVALDRLLLVQGWRRYAWNPGTGAEPFELKYRPEQGIEVHGQVVSMVRGKPRPGVRVSSFLLEPGKEEEADRAYFISTFDTDSLGRFAFISDIEGKWSLILSATEKGKRKDHRIVLDRLFSPQPRKYALAELQIDVAGRSGPVGQPELQAGTDRPEEEDFDRMMDAYEDSLAKAGIDEKIHRLGEVIVEAKRGSRESDIYESRVKSLAYYDVASEIDVIKDRGEWIGDDIHELMINMNTNFFRVYSQGEEYLQYKGRLPLFVVNYEPTMATELDYNKYKTLRLAAIKSVYINEELSAKCKYADPRMSPLEADEMYGCVVFIETYPEGQIAADAGKGVRKTWLDGYSAVAEFYQPDYSVLPKEADYRRTLYWNPALTPDEAGNVKIRFYNNSRCRTPKVEVETVSADGSIGSYRE